MLSFKNIAIFSIVAFIASLFIIVSVTSSPPKESNIIRDFSAHRVAYEQVRRMLSEDKDVVTVADYGIENTDSPFPRSRPMGNAGRQVSGVRST